MKAQKGLTLVACFLISATGFAQDKTNSTSQKLVGTSARLMFAELTRHERIQSYPGVQLVQASGVVCIATDVVEKTNYGCLVSEDGRSQPHYVKGADLDGKLLE